MVSTPPPPQQGVLDVAKLLRTSFLGRSSRTELQILAGLKRIRERRKGSWSDSSTVRIITAKIRTGWKTGAFYK